MKKLDPYVDLPGAEDLGGRRLGWHLVGRRQRQPPKHQMVPITKKGHRYPS
ncbi:MAG: hypothetical protein ACR2K3_01440 [Nocardioides sp.]